MEERVSVEEQGPSSEGSRSGGGKKSTEGQRDWRMRTPAICGGHGEIGTVFILVGRWPSCRREM